MFEVSVEQTFAAAHALRNYKGGCENVHGHNFKVQVVLAGEKLDDTGLLVDFIDVKNLMGQVMARLDHQNLNEDRALRREESVGREHRRVFLLTNDQRTGQYARAGAHSRSEDLGDRYPKRDV